MSSYNDTYPVMPSIASSNLRMLLLLPVVALVITGLVFIRPRVMAAPETTVSRETTLSSDTAVSSPIIAKNVPSSGISPVFTPEVRYWEPQILAWAAEFDLDPNAVATIMQVESCGDATAVSHAGAQGLFQVMPFHFAAGEDPFDPDTNARRGLAYFAERLQQTNGDMGRAFAGYNGGHVAAGGSWDTWAAETQAYYTWTTGIYADAQAGSAESPTLQQWQEVGGGSYCQLVAAQLGIAP
ncbi:MAG: transglycosylase SLT domain-containing protein [Ardenticatenaceae bacterium]|nr:transglycosylase SLT domain-containing protein [Anaerolineales bacterium]MCB8920431.1 transglycosylase SLT domain-containing protein [Ardenticatenaceae bacterium]MCB8989386.1 transglycosylase SLT domain-containing protein [Ardenticatenaceae bacterium]MCB9004541.1 transglycosylase SLT domain-containing protein [Ardenticatenaceae bacterium]